MNEINTSIPIPLCKKCTRCEKNLPLDNFYKHKCMRDGVRSQCKACCEISSPNNPEWNRQHYLKNKEKIKLKAAKHYADRDQAGKNMVKERVRAFRLLRQYGLTRDAYVSLNESQRGLCAICGLIDPARELSVDHSHVTGKVRELLCGKCNRAIGYMGDSIERLASAVRYLLKHSESNNAKETVQTEPEQRN